MGLNHNKKRNVGLLREFFSRHIASSIIDKDKPEAIKAKNIWIKYNQNTEIQKELKVLTALLETKFTNRQVAYEYMCKLKRYCTTISESKLETEKTNLIREVHSKIADKNFYNRPVNNYVDIASAQLLVSHWIKNGDEINSEYEKLEDKVLNHICTENVVKTKNENPLNALTTTDENVDNLVIKLMNEKFNKKFTNNLTEDQKYILRNFIFEDNFQALKEKMENLRDTALELIDEEVRKNDIHESDKKRLSEIRNLLITDYYDINNLEDSNVVFYMSISKLNEELKEEGE